jgi:hypothetical protein
LFLPEVMLAMARWRDVAVDVSPTPLPSTRALTLARYNLTRREDKTRMPGNHLD